MNNSVYLANASFAVSSSAPTLTTTFGSFCWTVAAVYVLLLMSTVFLIAVMIQHHEHLTGSRILIFHQIVMEAQITLFYWPVNNVLLPLISTNVLTVTNSFCRHFYFGFVITLTATWCGLAILALNRFVAVIRPFSYKRWVTKWATGVQLLIPWTVGIATTIRFFFTDGGFFFFPKGKTCLVQTGKDFLISSVFGVYSPLALTCVLYVGLFVGINLKKQNRKMLVQPSSHGPSERSSHGVNTAQRSVRRIKLAKGLLIISIIHLIGFASNPVFLAIVPDAQVRYPVAKQWIMLVFYVGYLSTPVIVGLTNQDVMVIVRKVQKAVHCS